MFVVSVAWATKEQSAGYETSSVDFAKACRFITKNMQEFEDLLQKYAEQGKKADESILARLKVLQKEYDEFGEACKYKVNQGK